MDIKADNLYLSKIEEVFKRRTNKEIDYLLKIVTLLIYNNIRNSDLIELYHMVGLDVFIKIIDLFSDRRIVFPNKKKLKDCFLIALVKYYKDKGMNYQDIKSRIGIDFSSIEVGIKLNQLDHFLEEQISRIYKEMEAEGVENAGKNIAGSG